MLALKKGEVSLCSLIWESLALDACWWCGLSRLCRYCSSRKLFTKKTALGGVKEERGRDQTLKELFSYDHFTAHCLVLRSSTFLNTCNCVQEQPGEKMLGLPLGLWSKAGEVLGGKQALFRVGGLGDQAHKCRGGSLQLWDLALPTPACNCASSSSNNTAVDKRLCVSSTGAEVVLESEMAGSWLRWVLACWQIRWSWLEETLKPLRELQIPAHGKHAHYGFVLALSGCGCSRLITALWGTGECLWSVFFPIWGSMCESSLLCWRRCCLCSSTEVWGCMSSLSWFGARLEWQFKLIFIEFHGI